jgi:hypothetical protein
LSGTAMLAVVSGSSINTRTLTGTANEIAIIDGNGAGNPTFRIASNPVIPGVAGMVVPVGTAAQEPVGTDGQLRFNSDTQTFDGYSAGQWRSFTSSGGVLSFSGGLTGLLPASPTSGVVTLSGVLNAVSGGTGQSSYTTGDVLYATTSTSLDKLTLGTSGDVLTAGASAPQYVAQSALSVGYATNAGSATTATTATNVAGGTTGSVPYQSNTSTTTFLALGTSSYIMTANASAPQWTDPASITVGSATSATTATNLASGATGSVPYQSGSGATTFLALGTATYIMTAGASAPGWTDPSSVTIGTATNVNITASTTNATHYLTFVDATSGGEPVLVNSSITCNPSTGQITGGISGGTF